MLIRAPYPAEARLLWQLRNQSIRWGCQTAFTPAEIAQWTPDDMPESWIGIVLQPGFRVVEIDGVVCATGLLDATAGRIEAMFVGPAHQGQGVGQHLLQHLIELVRAQGLSTLSLSATPNAVAFYRALGFQASEGGCYVSPTGLRLDCRSMVLKL